MDKRILTFVPVVALIIVSMIGLGLAYNSTISSESNIIGSYSNIVGEVNGSPVNGVSIIVDNSKDPPIYSLSFTSSSGTQETLLLHYHHTEGTDLILSISFVMSGLGERNPTIICYNGTDIAGSTVLSGTGDKSGTISGIVLGFKNEKTDDNFDCRFEIQGISSVEDLSVQMSFSVHPRGVSS